MKIILSITIVMFLFSLTSVNADAMIPTEDWVACGAYLQEAKLYVNAEWTKADIHKICVDLLVNGKITIERDQRDIIIIWTYVGQAVKIPWWTL